MLAIYGYDDLGRRTSLARGNGTTTGYQYDPVSRLSQMIHNLGGSATAHDLTLGFAYNPASQIVSVSRSNDLYAWTRHGSGTTSTTANGRNQLASWNAPLTYDSKGNLTSDGTNGFAYSSENLLTSLTVPPWGTAALSYDSLMRFAESGGQRFLSFADELIAEYYQGGMVSRFVPGAGMDESAARLNGSGVRSWYYPDERGSTLAVAGDSGTASQIVAYDEYGRPGATSPPRIGYTGQPLLSFGLLYDYRNRIYHAGLGRFLQPDPIGYESGLNLYAYVRGDPVNLIDPSGTGGVLDCNRWYCVWRKDIEISASAPHTNAGNAALLRGSFGRGGGNVGGGTGGGTRNREAPQRDAFAGRPNYCFSKLYQLGEAADDVGKMAQVVGLLAIVSRAGSGLWVAGGLMRFSADVMKWQAGAEFPGDSLVQAGFQRYAGLDIFGDAAMEVAAEMARIKFKPDPCK